MLFNELESTDDEVDELGAVLVALEAEDVREDQDDHVVHPLSWGLPYSKRYLDDGVGQKQHDSDVLEAVRGQQEADSRSLHHVAEGGLHLVVQVALLRDLLGLVDQSQQLGLGPKVVLVLGEGHQYLLKKVDLLLKLRLEGLHLVERALVLLDDGLDFGEGVHGGTDHCEGE